MKITVAEWRQFIAAWDAHPDGDDWYLEGQEYPDADDASVNLFDRFEVTGVMGWQGEGDEKPVDFLGDHSLSTAIRKWRRANHFDVLTLVVPKEQMRAVVAAAAALGATVAK